MNAEKYDELADRSALAMLQQAERSDALKMMEAHARVHDVISAMKEEGMALELTDEEERMLRSFRRFKSVCKPGGVFKWQTRPEYGVQIPADVVIPGERSLIQDPQDVSEA